MEGGGRGKGRAGKRVGGGWASAGQDRVCGSNGVGALHGSHGSHGSHGLQVRAASQNKSWSQTLARSPNDLLGLLC